LPNTVPTIDGVEHIDPEVVYQHLLNGSAILVDVRGDDRAAGCIEGTQHVPAIDTIPFPSKVPQLVQQYEAADLVVFTCQYSAHRAPQCANWYREKASSRQRVGILTGGFRAWEGIGLPVKQAATKPAEVKSADDFAMKQGVTFVQHYGGIHYAQAYTMAHHLTLPSARS
jgi:rhodanese-related sulfurtransferase